MNERGALRMAAAMPPASSSSRSSVQSTTTCWSSSPDHSIKQTPIAPPDGREWPSARAGRSAPQRILCAAVRIRASSMLRDTSAARITSRSTPAPRASAASRRRRPRNAIATRDRSHRRSPIRRAQDKTRPGVAKGVRRAIVITYHHQRLRQPGPQMGGGVESRSEVEPFGAGR